MTAVPVDAKIIKDVTATRAWLPLQLALITWRNLLTIFRTPEALLPPLGISIFFLVIYDSTLGKASGFIPELGGNSYLGFILPLSIVSSSLSGAGSSGVRIESSGRIDFGRLPLT